MGISINNSNNVNTAILSARAAEKLFAESATKLATGKRITSSSIDAAGAAMAARMNSEIATAGQAMKNINDAISLLQTYEANAESVLSMIRKMKTISVASASETFSASDNSVLVGEYNQLRDEIIGISKRAHWNEMNLFDGSAGSNGVIKITDGTATIDLDLGTTYNALDNTLSRSGAGLVNGNAQILTIADSTNIKSGDILSFTLYNVPNQQAQVYSYRLSQSDIDTINSASTSAIDGDPIFISNLGQQTGYSISVSGSNSSGVVSIALQHSTSNDLFIALDASSNLPENSPFLPIVHRGDVAPLMATYPYAPYGSQDTLKAIDSVLNSFTSKLAKVGAYINRLESSMNAIIDNKRNKMASKARIEDTDYAEATLDLTKSKIIKEASMLMLKTGQDYKNLVLNLIR